MNNAKLWLVVKPTVGIPMFLSAVAIGSFAVHVAVVTNTTWVGDFLSGNEMGSTQTASIEPTVKPASFEGDTVRFYSVSADTTTGTNEMVVVLPDGRMGKAVFTEPVAMASDGALPDKSN
ncbi:MAG: light-harvesting protein [Pseudomonadota bacterium]